MERPGKVMFPDGLEYDLL